MDPNANLFQQNRLLAAWMERLDTRDERADLRELRAALTGWLAAGGFHPDWAAYPLAARYFGHGRATAAGVLPWGLK